MSRTGGEAIVTGEQPSSAEALRFSEATERAFQQLLTHYPDKQAMVLPALHLAQEEFGYVSVRAMEYVAERLGLPPAKVLSAATFYTMFNRHPVGTYHINVCTSPPCALVGSDRVVRFFEQKLGIRVGQTTPDRHFTLNRTECLASCGTGPMLQCNGRYYEELTDERLESLLESWVRGTE